MYGKCSQMPYFEMVSSVHCAIKTIVDLGWLAYSLSAHRARYFNKCMNDNEILVYMEWYRTTFDSYEMLAKVVMLFVGWIILFLFCRTIKHIHIRDILPGISTINTTCKYTNI